MEVGIFWDLEFGIWDLVLGVSLVLGAWMLELISWKLARGFFSCIRQTAVYVCGILVGSDGCSAWSETVGVDRDEITETKVY